IVERKRGAPVGRAEISEHEARELVRGIGALPDALAEAAARGLAGGLQTAAVDVVDPAVIAAAQAALERNPQLERRAERRAVQMQHADAPPAVAKDHEILAQDPHPQGRRREIAREGDGLPEAAQILAARRAGADLGHLGIGRRDFTATVAVERTGLWLGGTPSGSLHDTSP